MKNPKVLYIVIIVICTLALIAGIYAQFFVKEEKRNNVIIPDINPGHEEEPTELTPEQIEAKFKDLFTNVLNASNYDSSHINKINLEKDLVYTDLDIIDQKDNYEINIQVPTINIAGEVIQNINNNIKNVFANKATEIMNSQSDTKIIYQISYTAYINENILSLIIKGTIKQGNNPQRVVLQTYNYNLETGTKVGINELIAYKNLNANDVQNEIKTTVEKAQKEAEILAQSGYTIYNRDLNSSIYELANISNYFLGPDGELYIIFAYGNQNSTSEMDIILYN